MLIGNVGREPEVRYLDTGVAVATFTVATTERAYRAFRCRMSDTGRGGGNSHRRGRLSSYGGSDAHHAGKRTPFGTCREGIQDAAYYDQGINLYSCALFLSLQNRKRAYLFRQQNNSRGYSVPQSTDENIFQFRKDRDSREETP